MDAFIITVNGFQRTSISHWAPIIYPWFVDMAQRHIIKPCLSEFILIDRNMTAVTAMGQKDMPAAFRKRPSVLQSAHRSKLVIHRLCNLLPVVTHAVNN